MGKLNLLLLPFIFLSTAYGQSTEFSAHLNSGLTSFGGESATESSFIIVSDVGLEGNYTNNPYGRKKKLSYGLSLMVQRITRYKLIFGLQSGYEVLRSQVSIDDVAGDFPNPPSSVSGQTIFKNGFIILYPNFGRRFVYNDLDIDLTVGSEFGFNVVSEEKGKSKTNNNTVIRTDRERSHANPDVRLRSSLSAYYKSWGISTGYSYGLLNYSRDLIGDNRERFSRFIRFGITYRLN